MDSEKENERRDDSMEEWLWVRMGEYGEYEKYDGPSEMWEMLAECGVKEIKRRAKTYGVVSVGHEGMDYISLYWGDDDAQPTGEISDEDIAYINERLAGA